MQFKGVAIRIYLEPCLSRGWEGKIVSKIQLLGEALKRTSAILSGSLLSIEKVIL
ncbi:hypothetical protein VSP9026_00389 [Vibrio spartinae]|uniref:Uncharacterized protein n=1 Tax=Vibrio spartinae TaxID=1918945 RepID=A0A1N6M003_9VIBR|nr:hypothetical protein VSP9026_00389 [Vibrio spartinae]